MKTEQTMKKTTLENARPLEAAHGAAAPRIAATRRKPASFLRRVGPWILLSLVAIGGGVAAVQTVRFYSHNAQTDDAQIESHVVPMLPKIAGTVMEVGVNDNQTVTAGQVLVRIDPRDYAARVQMAEANLANAHAMVDVARANVAMVMTKRTKTAADLTRYRNLRDKEEISQQEYDTAKAAADAAQAEHQAALRQVAAAEAQLAQRQADLDFARLQLSYTTLVAPVGGTVTKRTVEVGQYVQAGEPLLAVVEDHDVWVVANYKETQLRDMRVGEPAEVAADAYPGRVFHGRVDSIAAATGARFALLPPDNATGNFVKVVQRIPVKIVLTDPPDPLHPLRVGMNVVATIRVR